MRNNKLTIVGTISNIAEYDTVGTPAHTLYKMTVTSIRLSGKPDTLPCLVDGERVPVAYLQEHVPYVIDGQVRTRREVTEDGVRHNRVYISVECVTPLMADGNKNTNSVHIIGTLCDKPAYCVKNDQRRVSTVIVRVKGHGTRSYFIPCVMWGNTASMSKTLTKGECVSISGRLQAREYFKPLANGDIYRGLAYELSVQQCEVVQCE